MPSLPRPTRFLCACLLPLALARVAAAQTIDLPQPIPPTNRAVELVYFINGSATPMGTDLGRSTIEAQGALTLVSDQDGIAQYGLGYDPFRCHVYYCWGNQIFRIDADGKNRVLVRGADSFGAGIAVDPIGERLYYVNPLVGTRIRSCRLDGTDQRDLTPVPPTFALSPGSIDVDGQERRIYWWDIGAFGTTGGFRCGILDANDDLLCFRDIYPTGNISGGVDVDTVNDVFYWGNGAQIFRAPIPPDGPDPCVAPTSFAMPELVAENPPGLGNVGYLSVVAEPRRPGGGRIGWVLASTNLFRWRELKGTWPVPVNVVGALPEAGLVRSLLLVPGPAVCFALIPSVVDPAGGLRIRIEGARPGSPIVVRLLELAGRPVDVRVLAGVLDESGELAAALPRAANLSGKEARLEALVLDPDSSCLLRRETTFRFP